MEKSISLMVLCDCARRKMFPMESMVICEEASIGGRSPYAVGSSEGLR